MMRRQSSNWEPSAVSDQSARSAMAFSAVGHAYNHLFEPIFYVVALVLAPQMGLTYEEALALIITGKVLWGVCAPAMGWAADKWSTVGMIGVYFLGLGGAAMAVGLARDAWQIGAALTLLGVFGSIYHPVGIAWLVRSAKNRGKALGINGVFGGLGPAVGGIVGAALAEWFGWRWAFLVPGAVVVATGLVFLALVRSGRIADSHHDRVAEPEPEKRDMVRVYLILTVTMLCGGLIYQATQASLPKLFDLGARDVLGEGLFGVGGAVTLVYGVAGLVQVFSGHLADRYPPHRVYLFALLIQAPLLAAAGGLLGLPLILVALLMVTINIGQLPAENVLFTRYTPARWRSTAFGFKFVLAFGVSSLGVALIPAYQSLGGGYPWLFGSLGLLAALAAAMALLLPGPERTAEAEAPAPAAE